MSDAEKQATQVVEEILKRLVEAASTDTVRVKLRNLNEACSHLIMNGKQRLTVPLVLSTYAAMFPAKDQSIAESSIRNKRGGANPYLELYRAWEDAGEVILARPRKMGKAKPGEIIDYTELSSIPDPTLRHQVKLLIAQNTSLKSQLDIVRQVKTRLPLPWSRRLARHLRARRGLRSRNSPRVRSRPSETSLPNGS